MNAFGGTLSPALQRLGAVSVKLSVELGTTSMALKDVLALAEGSVVSLDKLTDELLDITANGQVIARGEVIAQDGKFALRIVSLAGGEGAMSPPPSSAPRPDVTPKPATAPATEPASEVPSPQPSVEPTKQAPSEVGEPTAKETEADALLDALDELTDAPASTGGDEPETDEEI
jgi:flagellar motor switch protein FliN